MTALGSGDVGKENTHLEIRVAAPQEAGNRSASRACHTALGHILKGLYILLQDICATMFIAALFKVARNSLDVHLWTICNENVVHLHNVGYYSVL